jgi:hypothetical protein
MAGEAPVPGRVRAPAVVHMTSLSLRKVQEMLLAGQMPGG